MARTKDTATFSAEAYRSTVEGMRARRESVHDAGERVFQTTGELDPNVNIFGKKRVSRNSMIPGEGGYILKNGVALPIFSGFDGTGSMGGNVEKAFYAVPVFNDMLAGIRYRYNSQIASAVLQDICDPHPVFQMSQFESDVRIAEQIRLLVPDHGGGDETEDYDFGLAFLLIATQTDIYDFYGLRGYALIVADQIGRGVVHPDAVLRHLGHTLQTSMSSRDICRALLQKWHLYYVQVGSGGGARRNYITEWWEDKMGEDRVIIVPDPEYLAEVQAGLIYITETEQPSEHGLTDFLLAGGQNKRISTSEARDVWSWLQYAQPHFGAQARLPGYNEIPRPGDTFAHFRDPWPIGHSRFSENPSAGGKPATPSSTSPTPPKIDWSKF